MRTLTLLTLSAVAGFHGQIGLSILLLAGAIFDGGIVCKQVKQANK